MSIDREIESGADYSLSYGILEEVAAIKGVSPRELDPLYDAVDPDALENLLEGLSGEGHVAFDYEGCVVQVGSEGETIIYESASV